MLKVHSFLGLIRLVKYLSQDHLLGKQRAVKFVVDAGTGTTAVGLGLGALCLGFVQNLSGEIHMRIALVSNVTKLC